MARKFDPYQGSPITSEQKRVGSLSFEGLEALQDWVAKQDEELIRDKLSVQEALDLYHASIEHDSFEGWLKEEPKLAVRAYNKCVKDKENKLPKPVADEAEEADEAEAA